MGCAQHNERSGQKTGQAPGTRVEREKADDKREKGGGVENVFATSMKVRTWTSPGYVGMSKNPASWPVCPENITLGLFYPIKPFPFIP